VDGGCGLSSPELDLAPHDGRQDPFSRMTAFLPPSTAPPALSVARTSIAESVQRLWLEVRTGVHTGEVETIAGKVGGIAVMIGARIEAIAEPSEVLVSGTVRDLVAGSGLSFEPRGEYELKGVPDRWRLYPGRERTGPIVR
jgi:class 3 adenylate cyclase